MRSLILGLGVSALALACGGGEAAQVLDDTQSGAPSPTPTSAAPTPSSPGAPTAPTPAPEPAPTSTPTTPPVTATACFKDLTGSIPGPDYDQFKPTIAKSCSGTQHQKITGIEKVVFLGDSVTAGTPPTAINDFYRSRVVEGLKTRFGAGIAVADCSVWGARTDDFIEGKNQVGTCFPNPTEPKKTLIVMTMGGNDIHAWAKNKISTAEAMVQADEAADKLRDTILYLQAPGRFPKGVNIVFANVYEFTDTSGDMASCPAATLAGMSGTWPAGAPAIVHFQERFMKIAADTKTDMIFLMEAFCGHGYKRNDPSLQCYRGPGAALWFDLTCIHPTPEGHKQIAKLFLDVVDGK